MRFRILGALVACLCLSGCAGKSAPVVVAQTSLGIAQTIGAVQTGATSLHQAGVIDAKTALRIQERLLAINTKVGEIVPYLKAFDRLSQAGVKPAPAEVDAVLTQIFLIAQELSLIGADVPGGEGSKAFLELLRTSQQTVTTTMIEIARLRVALEG